MWTVKKEVRRSHIMRELYACYVSKFGEKMVIDRDPCYHILCANGLSQRNEWSCLKTTNSTPNFYICPDLLNVTS